MRARGGMQNATRAGRHPMGSIGLPGPISAIGHVRQGSAA
jgi:hypothetical protein